MKCKHSSVLIESKQGRAVSQGVDIRPGLQGGPRSCVFGNHQVNTDIHCCV